MRQPPGRMPMQPAIARNIPLPQMPRLAPAGTGVRRGIARIQHLSAAFTEEVI